MAGYLVEAGHGLVKGLFQVLHSYQRHNYTSHGAYQHYAQAGYQRAQGRAKQVKGLHPLLCYRAYTREYPEKYAQHYRGDQGGYDARTKALEIRHVAVGGALVAHNGPHHASRKENLCMYLRGGKQANPAFSPFVS